MLLLNGSQDPLALGAAQQHNRTAAVVQRRGEHIPAAGMEEWREGRRDVAIPKPPADLRIDRVPGEHTVREDSTLGSASRAGSVENERWLLAIVGRERHGARGQCFVRAGERAEGQRAERRSILCQQLDGNRQSWLAVRLVVQQKRGGAVRQNGAQLVDGEPPVERYQDSAQQRTGEEGIQVFGGIARQDGYSIPLPHAIRFREHGGQRAGTSIECQVGVTLTCASVNQSDLLRSELLALRQPLSHAKKCHRSSFPHRSAVAPQVKPRPALASTTRSPSCNRSRASSSAST